MLGIPDVRSCCGCCSVELGAKIIAWIQLITAALFFAYHIESVIEILRISHHLYRNNNGAFVLYVMIRLTLFIYLMVQGILLMVGIKKKKAGILLAWLIVSFTFEMCVTSLMIVSYAVFYTLASGNIYGGVIIYIGGIQIGISFFFIVVVSTCRKNILRRNALFDYGVIYTPEVVEILTPERPKGIIPTNSQFDYASLGTPEDKPEDVIVT